MNLSKSLDGSLLEKVHTALAPVHAGTGAPVWSSRLNANCASTSSTSTIKAETEAYPVGVRPGIAVGVVFDASAVSSDTERSGVEAVADAEDSLGLGVPLHRDHARPHRHRLAGDGRHGAAGDGVNYRLPRSFVL